MNYCNATLDELERAAYMRGDVELARLYADAADYVCPVSYTHLTLPTKA